MQFLNKVVLITGAASGIGKAAAIAFASQGAKVVVSDRNLEGAEAVADEIKEFGREALAVKADVAKYEDHQALVKTAVETFGSLDIAINNAGIGSEMKPTQAIRLADWDRVIAINQSGVFYGMKEQLAVMASQKSGCIVNVSSIAGLRGLPNQIPYVASKFAVIGMTKTAAMEYARLGIRVNAVCPVFTKTPLLDQLFEMADGMDQKLLKTIPVRRFGEVEDVINVMFWLCDEKSSFITGQAIPIDGGQTS